ncbi:phosphotransferase [Streptomyces sp. NPDC058405]|uniref:phosphotransferase n=1 Tax=Streptomyces sp. NPDC058405 TaxID=3346482 RepID=UPI00366471A1
MLGHRLLSTVTSHNTPTTLYYFSAGGATYVLKVEFGQGQTLRDEIQWYRDTARISLPRELFVGSHIGKNFSFVLLKYFGDGSTVDDAALAGAPAHELGRHIVRALRGEAELFERTKRSATSAQMHLLVTRRYDQRRTQALAFPYLRRLMDARFVTVNGESLHGPAHCWSRTADAKPILEYLTPRQVGMTFGDLHCGNILIGGSSTEVVDPRGGALLPVTYDYGKLVQSIEGDYGAIMAGRYVLRRPADGEYEFAADSTAGYAGLAALMAEHCDERLYLQSLYQAALHFSAMLPHHASAEEETTALYLSGTVLFNKLLARLA